MEKELFTIISGGVLVIIYYWYFTSTKITSMTNDKEFEMEKVFIEEVSAGEKSSRIAFIYSLSDLVILKSLFQSEQIPFFCEFEHLSKIKTGLPITQINNIIFNVLDKDIYDSLFVINEYKKNKTASKKTLTKIRSVLEFICISNAIPSAETCNIRLLVKEK
jgi:hypothetical protein